MERKLYGVSSGNGNDGVSRMFADYYVWTSDPWRLAELAAVSDFKPGKGKAWAKRNADIDGDAEYGITAALYAPPCEETEDGEYPEAPDGVAEEDMEDGRNYSDGLGAWALYEVFPEDEPRDGRPVYDSLEECFSADDLALVPAEKVRG